MESRDGATSQHQRAAFHHETAAHHHTQAANHYAAGRHGQGDLHAESATLHGQKASEHGDRARDQRGFTGTGSNQGRQGPKDGGRQARAGDRPFDENRNDDRRASQTDANHEDDQDQHEDVDDRGDRHDNRRGARQPQALGGRH